MIIRFFGYVMLVVSVVLLLLAMFITMGCNDTPEQDTSIGKHRLQEVRDLANHRFWCRKQVIMIETLEGMTLEEVHALRCEWQCAKFVLVKDVGKIARY